MPLIKVTYTFNPLLVVLPRIKFRIRHSITGLHFQAGSSTDLVAQVEWAVAHPKEIAGMCQTARSEYEEKYTAKINYRKLIMIYNRLLGIST